MKIAILGAGGMGALIGGHIKKGGATVCFVDPYRAHMEAIGRDGLQMQVAGEEAEVVAIDVATTDAQDVGACDAVIIMVKGQNTAATVEKNMALFAPDTVALTLQNGVGNADILLQTFPEENVGFGVVKAAASLLAPGVISGVVHRAPNPGIYFASVRNHKKYDETYRKLEQALNDGGFCSHYTPDAEKEVWVKMFTNALFNMPCSLTRVTMGTMIGHPNGDALLQALGHEVVDVANAKGLNLVFETLWDYFDARIRRSATAKHYPSAAQDVKNKRTTEVEFLNGAVMREGAKHGIATPYNAAVYHLSKVLEDTYAEQF